MNFIQYVKMDRMTSIDSRRRKAPAERREEILAAALDCFARRGVDGTTMQELAEAAGMAAGTVYLYFPSKEHVLAALHDRFHAGMQERFAETGSELLERLGEEGIDVGAGIDAIFDAIVGYSLEHRTAYVVLAQYLPRIKGERLPPDEGLVDALAWAIGEGMARGLVATSDPQTTARLLYLAVREALSEALLDGDEALAQRVVAQAKELARKALAP